MASDDTMPQPEQPIEAPAEPAGAGSTNASQGLSQEDFDAAKTDELYRQYLQTFGYNEEKNKGPAPKKQSVRQSGNQTVVEQQTTATDKKQPKDDKPATNETNENKGNPRDRTTVTNPSVSGDGAKATAQGDTVHVELTTKVDAPKTSPTLAPLSYAIWRALTEEEKRQAFNEALAAKEARLLAEEAAKKDALRQTGGNQEEADRYLKDKKEKETYSDWQKRKEKEQNETPEQPTQEENPDNAKKEEREQPQRVSETPKEKPETNTATPAAEQPKQDFGPDTTPQDTSSQQPDASESQPEPLQTKRPDKKPGTAKTDTPTKQEEAGYQEPASEDKQEKQQPEAEEPNEKPATSQPETEPKATQSPEQLLNENNNETPKKETAEEPKPQPKEAAKNEPASPEKPEAQGFAEEPVEQPRGIPYPEDQLAARRRNRGTKYREGKPPAPSEKNQATAPQQSTTIPSLVSGTEDLEKGPMVPPGPGQKSEQSAPPQDAEGPQAEGEDVGDGSEIPENYDRGDAESEKGLRKINAQINRLNAQMKTELRGKKPQMRDLEKKKAKLGRIKFKLYLVFLSLPVTLLILLPLWLFGIGEVLTVPLVNFFRKTFKDIFVLEAEIHSLQRQLGGASPEKLKNIANRIKTLSKQRVELKKQMGQKSMGQSMLENTTPGTSSVSQATQGVGKSAPLKKAA